MLMVIGYCTMGAGFLVYILGSSLIYLFAAQFVIGIGEAIYSPAFDSLYSTHIDAGSSGTEWGAWESINYISIGLGALLGDWIVKMLGLKYYSFPWGYSVFSAPRGYFWPRRNYSKRVK